MSTVIGELTEVLEWKITDFSSLSGTCYRSASFFHVSGVSLYMKIYPNGYYLPTWQRNDSSRSDQVSVYLHREDSGPPVSLEGTLFLKTANGAKFRGYDFKHAFDARDGVGCGCHLASRSTLINYTYGPTVVCSLRFPGPKDLGGSMKPKKARIEVSTQTEAELGIEKLSRDLNGLMLNGDDSDLTVRVKGEDFRLHRNILRARTPVFNSMFKHEMKEKTTGIVSIDDCQADTFRTFLHYVYTGRVDKLSAENVFGLYEVADKYQIQELKSDCMECVKNTLSVDTFCDAISLALRHDEKELLKLAIGLLSDKMKEIIMTVKWQLFLSENPTWANELLIKALVNKEGKNMSDQPGPSKRLSALPDHAKKRLKIIEVEEL